MNQADFQDENRSDLHLQGRALLREMYPYDLIFEEVLIPGEDLTFDFVVPLRRLVVECDGIQHTQYIPYFHKNLSGFSKSKLRDAQKVEFCNINNLTLVALSYRDTYEQWKQQLKDAFS